MDARAIRLGYCTNVHPAETPDELERMLRAEVAPALRRARVRDVGLRVGAAAALALDGDPSAATRFRATLAAHDLRVFTVNGFPYGEFHRERVKEAVYAPDWTTPERREYTAAIARLSASWASPEDPYATISTAPLGYAPSVRGREEAAAENLLALLPELRRIEDETGVRVVVALEPEPACAIETTDEAIDFFKNRLFARGREESVRRHFGICFDACHQAVLFEDADDAFVRLAAAGVPVAKVQISNALRVPAAAPEALNALLAFAEPRFLHQAVLRRADGARKSWLDLDAFAADVRRGEIAATDEVRCHFHVPIHATALPPLATTQDALNSTVRAARRLGECRHFEVETYTFDVLPPAARAARLDDHLVAELAYARALLDSSS